MADDDMLQLYVKYWNEYKSICNMLNAGSTYINRHWVARQHVSGATHVLQIHAVHYFSISSYVTTIS